SRRGGGLAATEAAFSFSRRAVNAARIEKRGLKTDATKNVGAFKFSATGNGCGVKPTRRETVASSNRRRGKRLRVK
ncbi:MAG: hypothetical protein IJO46_11540, partial [Thermoguttaceae bacterium]|nr:hypothetical protein [Thermoguttaceae bacterium]